MEQNSGIARLILIMLLLGARPYNALAASATATGPAALALAAVVAQQAPLGRFEKRTIARLFDGGTIIRHFLAGKISVTAASVVCRVSNVDITDRSCELTFRTNKRTVHGREANEIYSTMAAAGIAAEGAAGSLVESVSKLECTIDPSEIKRKTGGGADCAFETGQ
jgi:hypothetical protein